MFRKILLILFLCGLTGFSVLTEYRGSAETYACQVAGVCLPETPPEPCETIPCVHQKQMTEPVMRRPEVLPQGSTDFMLCRWCSLRMSCGQ
jgi:hypothetical protein